MSDPSSCRLCFELRPLQNSHIIPEWVYEPLYDKIHRYNVLGSDSGREASFSQKGVRERMLCQPCETALSVYEGYARGVLIGGREIEIQRTNGGVDVLGLNYTKFKLFQLSVLWRAGVARHGFFSGVQLGSHSEQLRRMLLAEDPGKNTEYGCTLVPLVAEGQLLTDLIAQPASLTANGFPMVRFLFGGHAWLYVLGQGNTYPLRHLFLSGTGTLPIRSGGKAVEGFIRSLAVTFGSSNGQAI